MGPHRQCHWQAVGMAPGKHRWFIRVWVFSQVPSQIDKHFGEWALKDVEYRVGRLTKPCLFGERGARTLEAWMNWYGFIHPTPTLANLNLVIFQAGCSASRLPDFSRLLNQFDGKSLLPLGLLSTTATRAHSKFLRGILCRRVSKW